MKPVYKFVHLPLLFLVAACACTAQNSQSPDSTLNADGLPVFLKVLPQPAPEPWTPITRKQRFDHYASQTFSPFAALGAASGAAISQGLNSPKEWGQGWGAYGIRAASGYGGTLVGNTITFGVSALVHEDNRFFRSKSEGFGARLEHVIASPYVSRNDAGRQRFSTSMLLGGAGSSGIPLAWSPASWQGWDNVGLNYLIWYGQVAGVNLVREFYPTLVRHFRSNSKSQNPPSASKH